MTAKKKQKRTKEFWYRRIADTIMQEVTFDSADKVINTQEYPSVYGMIADSMLRHLSAYEKHKRLDAYIQKIQLNFHNAIDFLQDRCGKNVYLIKRNNKTISCVTLEVEYRGAATGEELRIKNNLHKAIVAAKKQTSMKMPHLLPSVRDDATKLLLA